MRLTASRPFLPWPMMEISGKALRRKASSSRAGFSSSTMMVLMGIGVKGKYSAGKGRLDNSDQIAAIRKRLMVEFGRRDARVEVLRLSLSDSLPPAAGRPANTPYL